MNRSESGEPAGVNRFLTVVAAVHPHPVAVVPTPALHDVVGVIGLRNLVVGIDHHLCERRHEQQAVQIQIRNRLTLDYRF